MKTGLYQIFDRVATMPASPIVGFQREEAAVRWFREVYEQKDSAVNKYPRDHTLMKLGVQDVESGAIDAHLPTPVYDGDQMLDEAAPSAARDATRPPNGAMQADAEEIPNDSREILPAPTPAELSCQRCGKHYTMHVNNGACPDNSGRFQPTAALAAHYKAYLDSRAQLS